MGGARLPLWDEVVGEMQGCDLARQIREGTPILSRPSGPTA